MKWPDVGNLSRPGRIAAAAVMLCCGVVSMIWTYSATRQTRPIQTQFAAKPVVVQGPTTEETPAAPELVIKLDLNKASQAELELLPGVGPALSKRIIDYRDTHGPFEKFEDLDNVQGIGPRMLEKIRPLAEVRPPKPE